MVSRGIPEFLPNNLLKLTGLLTCTGKPDQVDITAQNADGEWISPNTQAVALVAFDGEGQGETSLQMGDNVKVFDVKLHWAFITSLDGKTYGWVPHRFLQEIEDVPRRSG